MLATDSSRTDLLDQLAAEFKTKPFIPPRVLTQADLQTLSAYFWPGRFPTRDRTGDEERLFEVEPDTKVLARCRWQSRRAEHATLVIWHGIEGSTASAYMLSSAAKAFHAGFNVVRVNYRNCGGTEHLTPTLYHGGMSGDVRAVVEELIERDGLSRIIAVGFSLGGNKVLKLAGEYGDNPPRELLGVGAISPSVNLRASCDLLMTRRNFVYHKDFLYYLKRRIKVKEKLFPERYDSSGLRRISSIRQFDDTYIAPMFGFADANDYYAKASSLPYVTHIRIPTLIIHAQDDPFVPFDPIHTLFPNHAAKDSNTVAEVSVGKNASILLLAPQRGGHVAFLSADSKGEDRFWAENRLVDFCRSLTRQTTS